MEFVFQILADLLSPVDEKKVKEENAKLAEEKKNEVNAEKVEEVKTDKPNLFGVMDFH